MTSLLKDHPGGKFTELDPPCMGRHFQFPGVYAIIHEQSGKAYVGSTADLYNRRCLHLSQLNNRCHGNPNLQEAYRASEEIRMEYLLMDTPEKARQIEQELLDKHMPTGALFNVCPSATSEAGWPRSEAVKRKLSALRAGRTLSEQHCRAISEGLKASSKHKKPVCVEGTTYPSIKEAAEALNLSMQVVHYRVNSKESSKFKEWTYV